MFFQTFRSISSKITLSLLIENYWKFWHTHVQNNGVLSWLHEDCQPNDINTTSQIKNLRLISYKVMIVQINANTCFLKFYVSFEYMLLGNIEYIYDQEKRPTKGFFWKNTASIRYQSTWKLKHSTDYSKANNESNSTTIIATLNKLKKVKKS